MIRLPRALLTCALPLVFLVGCRSDMQDQPKMYPQRGAVLFADGRSVRPQVPGTVSRSQNKDADYRTTGLVDGKPGDALPFPVSGDLLARGQERYNIYCAPCHSRVGNGKGAIVDRGYYPAASFHSERLRQAPLGYFFTVITNGYGAMPNYQAEIRVEDRWAIAAYIRALQLSQNARKADVPPGQNPVRLPEIASREGFIGNVLAPWGYKQEAPVDEDAPVAVVKTPVIPVPVAAALPGKVVAPVVGTLATHSVTGVATTGKAVAPEVPAVVAPVVVAKPKGDAVAGKKIYLANCSVCHQPTRAGLPPVFPSLIGIVDRTSAQHVRDTVRGGRPEAKPPMPAFTTLSATDLEDLIEFLRTGK